MEKRIRARSNRERPIAAANIFKIWLRRSRCVDKEYFAKDLSCAELFQWLVSSAALSMSNPEIGQKVGLSD